MSTTSALREKISTRLENEGFYICSDWIDQAIEFLSGNDHINAESCLFDKLMNLLLHSDLSDIVHTSHPMQIPDKILTMHNEHIFVNQIAVLQIVDVCNVSSNCSADFDGFEDVDSANSSATTENEFRETNDFDDAVTSGSSDLGSKVEHRHWTAKSVLKVWISDGMRTATAYDSRGILFTQLSSKKMRAVLKSLSGIKIRVSKMLVVHGVCWMSPESVQVIGGSIPIKDAMQCFAHVDLPTLHIPEDGSAAGHITVAADGDDSFGDAKYDNIQQSHIDEFKDSMSDHVKVNEQNLSYDTVAADQSITHDCASLSNDNTNSADIHAYSKNTSGFLAKARGYSSTESFDYKTKSAESHVQYSGTQPSYVWKLKNIAHITGPFLIRCFASRILDFTLHSTSNGQLFSSDTNELQPYRMIVELDDGDTTASALLSTQMCWKLLSSVASANELNVLVHMSSLDAEKFYSKMVNVLRNCLHGIFVVQTYSEVKSSMLDLKHGTGNAAAVTSQLIIIDALSMKIDNNHNKHNSSRCLNDTSNNAVVSIVTSWLQQLKSTRRI